MAFISKKGLIDEEEDAQSLETGGGQGAIIGNGGGAMASKVNTGSGSGFTDIKKYLDANKEGSAKLTGMLASDVSSAGEKAKTGIDAASSGFLADVESSTPKYDETLVSRAASDPVTFSSNEDDVSAFKSLRDASYSGPTSLEGRDDYGDVYRAAQEAKSKADLAGTEEGRTTLLKELTPNATSGQNTLNQMLVGADPNSMTTLKAAASPYQDILDYLASASSSAQDKVSEAKAAADSVKEQVASAVDASASGIGSDITGRVSSLAETNAPLYEKLKEAASLPTTTGPLEGYSGRGVVVPTTNYTQMTEDMASLLGLSPSEWLAYQVANPGADLSSLIGYTTPEARTVATADEYAKIKALESLMGKDYDALDVLYSGDAGTYSPFSFNTSGLNTPASSKPNSTTSTIEGGSVLEAIDDLINGGSTWNMNPSSWF